MKDDPTGRTQRLQGFVDWHAEHITGDEKGEAQTFLDHLFRAFGHAGVKEAGASFEWRVTGHLANPLESPPHARPDAAGVTSA